MGKIRTKIIGLEDVEKKQKEEAKKRREAKKIDNKSDNKSEDKNKNVGTALELSAQKKVEKKNVQKTKLRKRGKKYLEAKKQIEKITKGKEQVLDIGTALDIFKKIKHTNFDESVEVHLNVYDVGLKGEVEFPHGTGKSLRIAIVDDKILEDIEKGKINFDVLITHPSYMPKLAKYARVLGPKGLMPNPKAGTISPKPEEVAKKFEKGMTRWKTEPKAPIIHQLIGKISFENRALEENIIALLKSVGKSHIKDAFIKTTMSPVVKLNIGPIV